MSEAVAVGLAAILVNIILAIIGGIITLSHNNEKQQEKVDAKILQEKNALSQNIKDLNNELDEKVKWMGEALSVMRNKVTDTELWNRDNFVSKGTFTTIIREFKESVNRLEDNINGRFDKLNLKIDSNNHKISGGET